MYKINIKQWLLENQSSLLLLVFASVCIYSMSPIIISIFKLDLIFNPTYNPIPILPWYLNLIFGIGFVYYFCRLMPRCGL